MTKLISSLLAIHLVLMVFLLCSCESKERLTIRWTGGPDLATAQFYLNGTAVGSADDGLAKVFSRVSSLNEGANVIVEQPDSAVKFYEQKYGDFDGMPLPQKDDSPWRKLLGMKRINLTL